MSESGYLDFSVQSGQMLCEKSAARALKYGSSLCQHFKGMIPRRTGNNSCKPLQKNRKKCPRRTWA
jgi:hypothetical protein